MEGDRVTNLPKTSVNTLNGSLQNFHELYEVRINEAL